MRVHLFVSCLVVVFGALRAVATVPEAVTDGALVEGFIQEDALGRIGVDYLATDWEALDATRPFVEGAEPVADGSAVELQSARTLTDGKKGNRRFRARLVGIVALCVGIATGVLMGRLQPIAYAVRARLGILFRRRGRMPARSPVPSRDRRLHLVLEDAFVSKLAAGLAIDPGFVVVCHRRISDLPPGASWVCAWISGWEAGVDELLPARERSGRMVALLLSEATRSQVWAAVGRGAVACRTGPLDLECLESVLDRLARCRESGSATGLSDEVTSDLLSAGPPTPSIVARVMGTLGARVRGLARGGWLGGRIIRYDGAGFILVEATAGARHRRHLPLSARRLPVVHVGTRPLAGARGIPSRPFARAWARIALETVSEPDRREMLDRLIRVARGL